MSESQELPDTIKNRNLPIYDDYAPHVWFVSFDGTTNELTDLIWPDDHMEESHSIPEGIVIRMRWYNGFASTGLWEWLGIHRGE